MTMLKRLASLLSSCLSWVSSFCGNGIPDVVGGEERVMRTIFHPANFNEKKGTLKSNFMRPPTAADEKDDTIASNKLSTTRYDYCGMEFCRRHARAHQKEPRRHYWGFGRFVVEHLIAPRQIDGEMHSCTVEPKPEYDNPAHANINLGFRQAVGEPLDSQTAEYIKQLAESAEVLQDPSPTSEQWEGEPVDEARYGKLKYKPKKL